MTFFFFNLGIYKLKYFTEAAKNPNYVACLVKVVNFTFKATHQYAEFHVKGKHESNLMLEINWNLKALYIFKVKTKLQLLILNIESLLNF